jgi:NAD(P)-dependent dehydrogenase (short-subunit alcohol dehydrogenase family)
MSTSRRFEGKVVWVTGAGHGIGAATALRLADEGALVAVHAKHEKSARAIADECRRRAGDAVAGFGDVADLDVVARAHASIVKALGPVGVLVNNVAVARSAQLSDTTEDHWQYVLAVNFLAATRCSRLVIPGMQLRHSGVIVNISSDHQIRGFPGWSAYASAKGALASFTRQQAVELAPYGIRVVSVTPGAVLTEMNAKRFAEAEDAAALQKTFVDAIPLRRMGTPDEIAAAIAFVASDEASFMTGADLRIDGGEAIQGG